VGRPLLVRRAARTGRASPSRVRAAELAPAVAGPRRARARGGVRPGRRDRSWREARTGRTSPRTSAVSSHPE
jgi:hypothetical protein